MKISLSFNPKFWIIKIRHILNMPVPAADLSIISDILIVAVVFSGLWKKTKGNMMIRFRLFGRAARACSFVEKILRKSVVLTKDFLRIWKKSICAGG